MILTVYLKFWHPKHKLTWANKEEFPCMTTEEGLWCCEEFINEFLEAGWELIKKHIVW